MSLDLRPGCITREIVQVNFKTTTAAARTWAVFGNHCPSRSCGQFESGAIEQLLGRRSAISTGGFSRCTVLRHRYWRWRTTTTNRSTPPWFDTRSAPDSEPGHLCEGKPLLWNLMWPDAGLSLFRPTSPPCSISSWSTSTWPPATPRSRPTPTRPKSSNRRP
jgi:hypothetical protein